MLTLRALAGSAQTVSLAEDDIAIGLAALDRGLLTLAELLELTWHLGRARTGSTDMAALLVEAGYVTPADLPALCAGTTGQGTLATLATLGALAPTQHSVPIEMTPPPLDGERESLMQPIDDYGLDGERFRRRYVQGEEIGRGGVGRVTSFRDLLMGRTVAIKSLHDARASGTGLARFLTEARTTARLEHPNVVPVHDLGVGPDGAPYFTMKRVRGRSLRQVFEALERGEDADRFSRYRLLGVFAQVVMAVDYAHSLGVIHRDLKPENIMVGDFGEVFVMDWGIARVRGAAPEPEPEPGPLRFDSTPVTMVGTVFGTPGYMPPEQAAGQTDEMGPQTDVWALGAILYELLTGRRTHEAPSPLTVLVATVREDVVPPRKRAPHRDIPADLEEICLRALARDPARRYPTARALHEELERYLAGTRERERRAEEAAQLVEEGREVRWYMRTLAEELVAVRERLRQLPPLTGRDAAEAKRERWSLEDREEDLERERQSAFRWAEAKFVRATELVPGRADARHELADMHWQRYRQAREALDHPAAEEHLAAVARYDDGQFATLLAPTVPLHLETDPPGAEVVLFRYEPRDRLLVPVAERVLGRTPLEGVPVPTGRRLVEIRHPDRRPVRLPVLSGQGDTLRFRVPLPDDAALGADFVYVPAGPFLRGNDRDALMPSPSARVWLDAYAIARFPVTVAEYFAFLAALPDDEARRRAPREETGKPLLGPDADGRWTTPARDADGDLWDGAWPVVHVSFDDARAYAAWRGARDGARYRLPTEDEWEKAARGTDGRFFPWGDHFDPACCLMRDTDPGRPSLHPVGARATDESPYGVRDMAGSARAWTDSWFEPGQRAIRGGAWNLYANFCRAASRWGMSPGRPLANLGIRLVKDVQ
jgi:serine/threonine-protein kinase